MVPRFLSVEKIKKRYGNLGNIIRVKIVRTNNSIGIALAGHRNRNEMGCFIAGLNPKGAASSQNLQVGDEILEVSTFSLRPFQVYNFFFSTFYICVSLSPRLMVLFYIKCAI